MRLFILSVLQLACLSMGLSIIAALAPDLTIENPLIRTAVGAGAILLVLFGLNFHEGIHDITSRKQKERDHQ